VKSNRFLEVIAMHVSDLLKYQQEGNGVILRWDNLFVFAVGKEDYWNKTKEPWIITYTNTGGYLEIGETRVEATKREVKEELGCDVELLPSDQTLYCDLEDPHFVSYTLDDVFTPLLIYNSHVMELSVCVYLAQISSSPFPQREVPAILFLPPKLLHGGQLGDLLIHGCMIREQVKGYIPRSAIMKPFGSAKLLLNNWDKFMNTPSFRTLFS
jgi:hypothetical protein